MQRKRQRGMMRRELASDPNEVAALAEQAALAQVKVVKVFNGLAWVREAEAEAMQVLEVFNELAWVREPPEAAQLDAAQLDAAQLEVFNELAWVRVAAAEAVQLQVLEVFNELAWAREPREQRVELAVLAQQLRELLLPLGVGSSARQLICNRPQSGRKEWGALVSARRAIVVLEELVGSHPVGNNSRKPRHFHFGSNRNY